MVRWGTKLGAIALAGMMAGGCQAGSEAAMAGPLGGDGSIERPFEVGMAGDVGDWQIRLVGTVPEAEAVLVHWNWFNRPARPGMTYVMFEVEAVYRGTGSSQPWNDLYFGIAGPSRVAYDNFESDCGLFPEDLVNQGEAFTDGVMLGRVCWEVRSSDLAGLLVFVENRDDETASPIFFTPPET